MPKDNKDKRLQKPKPKPKLKKTAKKTYSEFQKELKRKEAFKQRHTTSSEELMKDIARKYGVSLPKSFSVKKKKALSKTTSKTVRGDKALYGKSKKKRSEQPRSTKYKIAGEDGSYQLRYRKVKY